MENKEFPQDQEPVIEELIFPEEETAPIQDLFPEDAPAVPEAPVPQEAIQEAPVPVEAILQEPVPEEPVPVEAILQEPLPEEPVEELLLPLEEFLPQEDQAFQETAPDFEEMF